MDRRQALRLDPTVIATCCPYCLTMFEDGVKDEKVEGKVKVLDVAEILMPSKIRFVDVDRHRAYGVRLTI